MFFNKYFNIISLKHKISLYINYVLLYIRDKKLEHYSLSVKYSRLSIENKIIINIIFSKADI